MTGLQAVDVHPRDKHHVEEQEHHVINLHWPRKIWVRGGEVERR